MKEKLRNIFIVMGRFLPQRFTHGVYLLPVKMLKMIFSLWGHDIWIRHSVYFHEEVFALSDVDITIWALYPESVHHYEKVMKTLSLARKVFPFIGEDTYYASSELSHNFVPLASRLELQRDPEMIKRRGVRGVYDLPQAFVLNWLWSDFKKMTHCWSDRQNKINRFLSILNFNPEHRGNAHELMESLWNKYLRINELSQKENQHIFNFLSLFLEKVQGESLSVNSFYRDYPEYRQQLMVFYPSLWLGAAIANESYEDDLYHMKSLSPREKDILYQQLSWELWGMFGKWRFHCREDMPAYILHLDHIEDCLNIVDRDGEALKALHRLKELCEVGAYDQGELHVV